MDKKGRGGRIQGSDKAFGVSLVRMAIIEKSTKINVGESGEKATFPHCWWECKLVQPLLIVVWRFPKKLKIELPYDPAILLLGIYPEKMKTNSKRYVHPNVHSGTI